jgi:MarR family multiple gene transcriptional regulator MgrA
MKVVVILEKILKIGMLLRMLNNKLTAQCNKDMGEVDLTGSQSNIMGYLMLNEGREVNQRDIELEFGLMNPTVTGILNRLEKKGFINRVKSEVDGRYKRVELTERGREVPEAIRKKAADMGKRLLKGLSESEIESLENTLKKLIDNISK